jgi:hypothetical protein
VLDEHVGNVFFPYPKMEGKGSIIVTRKQLHAGCFYRSDDEARGTGGMAYLPQRGCAGLLDLRVGREVFEREDVMGRET